MNRCFVLFVCLAFSLNAFAQSAVINNKWLEHNVTKDGVKGMIIHVDFNVKNMKGQQGKVLVYFECPKGTGLDDTNGSLRTTDGKVCVSKKFTPSYDNSHYNDFKIFMPIDEIHMKKGEFTYYCDIRIQDLSSRKFLNGETYLSFVGTSQGESGGNAKKTNQSQTWREELGYGMFAINQGNPNGVRQRTIWQTCSVCRGSTLCANCHGTRICSLCSGRGGIVTAGYGTYIPCSLCGQSGRCSICHGTGKCFCADSDYPGYMLGSTVIVGPDGRVIYNSRDYDKGSFSSDGSSSASSGGTCPKCGGLGVDTFPMYENDPSGAAVNVIAAHELGYQHINHSKCRYCGKYNYHVHLKCYKCR